MTIDAMLGISQSFDRKGKPITLIRLKYEKGKPAFQQILSGPHDEVLPEAKKIRDWKLKNLQKQGWRPNKRARVNPVKRNTSGVTGVRFRTERAKSGSGWYLYWQVSWSDKRQDGNPLPRAKAFYLSKYESPQMAFFAALDFRKDRELELYGYTLINPLKYREYWKTARKTMKLGGNGK